MSKTKIVPNINTNSLLINKPPKLAEMTQMEGATNTEKKTRLISEHLCQSINCKSIFIASNFSQSRSPIPFSTASAKNMTHQQKTVINRNALC